jgi:hypothetical protein
MSSDQVQEMTPWMMASSWAITSMGPWYHYRKNIDIVVRIVAKPGQVLFGTGLHYTGFELSSPVYRDMLCTGGGRVGPGTMTQAWERELILITDNEYVSRQVRLILSSSDRADGILNARGHKGPECMGMNGDVVK